MKLPTTLLAGAFTAAVLLQLAAHRADAMPVQGATPWSILLCKPRGVTNTSYAAQHFVDLFAPGPDGLDDYFRNQSRGRMTLQGSVVRGWYTTAFTEAQEVEKRKDDPNKSVYSRGDRIQHCVDAARAGGYTAPANHRIVVYLEGRIDSGTADNRVLLDAGPDRTSRSFVAHEMLHALGLAPESYANSQVNGDGVYDNPWDEMSAMAVHGVPNNRFGLGPVGLNGYHRDKLGWLPMDKIVSFRAGGATTQTITLGSLGSTANPNPQLVRVPSNVADPYQYFTVEYRRRTGYDAGIPNDTILIHEVKNGRTTLFRNNHQSGRAPTTTFDNGLGIKLALKSISADDAVIEITQTSPDGSTSSPNTCKAGYVWRGADSSDYVCVTTAVRAKTYEDNQGAYFRWAAGAYGPHTCTSGLVWRGAFWGDEVCVDTVTRDQVGADNAAAASRVERPQG